VKGCNWSIIQPFETLYHWAIATLYTILQCPVFQGFEQYSSILFFRNPSEAVVYVGMHKRNSADLSPVKLGIDKFIAHPGYRMRYTTCCCFFSCFKYFMYLSWSVLLSWLFHHASKDVVQSSWLDAPSQKKLDIMLNMPTIRPFYCRV